ncbi:MAG: PrgI family protein [Candidatus Andersenbacteria bacterium]
MRFQVPQFTDVEDKVIGPFTLRQFFMYVGAAMVLIPVYIFSDLSLFITIALPVAGIAAAFAHLKVNGKSLFTVITNALGFFTSSQIYLWRRTAKLRPIQIVDPEWQELVAAQTYEDTSPLSTAVQILETAGNVVRSEDIPDDLAPEIPAS